MSKQKLTEEQKKQNREARKLGRRLAANRARIEAEKSQKPVRRLTITIEWRKSRTWGSNPRAEAAVEFRDGTFTRRDGFTCSGCGYDKESTVVSDIFDAFLRYKLWRLPKSKITGGHGSGDTGPAPYGIQHYEGEDGYKSRGFADGVGMSCYYRLCEYLGGKLEHVASCKSSDVWVATFPRG